MEGKKDIHFKEAITCVTEMVYVCQEVTKQHLKNYTIILISFKNKSLKRYPQINKNGKNSSQYMHSEGNDPSWKQGHA